MELVNTINLMISEDYKERFIAEYVQTKIRAHKLLVTLTKYNHGTLEFKPTCPICVLQEQLECMQKYLSILETRAEFEHIDLEKYSKC